MAEHCLHEKDWGRMITIVEAQQKEIYGNGKKGIRDEVTNLSSNIETLTDSVNMLTTNVSALMKFQSGFEGVENYKKQQFSKDISRAGLYISIAAVIITVIMKLL